MKDKKKELYCLPAGTSYTWRGIMYATPNTLYRWAWSKAQAKEYFKRDLCLRHTKRPNDINLSTLDIRKELV